MLNFWNLTLYWADKTLFPWIKENLPDLEHYVRDAFAALDKVVTLIHNNIKALKKFTEIKEAWEMPRQYLLKVLVQFEQNTRNEWVKRIIYWTIRNFKFKQVVRVVAEEIVDADSLPLKVRQEWMKRGNTTQDVDVTQVRDRELEMISGEVEEIVDMDSLPDDVRLEWLKRGNTTQDIDVTQLRDRELELNKTEVVRVVTKETVDVDSLPDDIRRTQTTADVDVKVKSYINGWLANILAEEWRGELEVLRCEWFKEGKPKIWIGIMTGFYSLDILKGQLQTQLENKWLFKRKQG